MKNAKSFKELMEVVKERHPELKDSLEEMENVLTDKDINDLCLLCGCKKGDKDK